MNTKRINLNLNYILKNEDKNCTLTKLTQAPKDYRI